MIGMYPDNYLEEVLIQQQIMEEMNDSIEMAPRSSKLCKDVITKEDRISIKNKHYNAWRAENVNLAIGFKDSIEAALAKFFEYPNWDTTRKLNTIVESYSRVVGNSVENAIDDEIDELRKLREAAL